MVPAIPGAQQENIYRQTRVDTAVSGALDHGMPRVLSGPKEAGVMGILANNSGDTNSALGFQTSPGILF